VPDESHLVLLLVDVINDFEFEDAEPILQNALGAAKRIAALKGRAKTNRIPVVYANDNFGRWQSDFRKLLDHCLNDNVSGKPIAELLKPDDDDYFVLKPKHSAFYSTTLELLLAYLGARTLIVTGIAANNCVLFTAGDAYMRDFQLIVPSDCVASPTAKENESALQLMSSVLKADIRPSTELDIGKLKRLGYRPSVD
jgi:nicotinamidase-related amidase